MKCYSNIQQLFEPIVQITAEFKKKYKDDPIVQAILTNDIGSLAKSNIPKNKIFTIRSVINKKSFLKKKCDYINVKFDYIALAFLSMGSMFNFNVKLQPHDLSKLKPLIKLLIKKGVKSQGKFSYKFYKKEYGNDREVLNMTGNMRDHLEQQISDGPKEIDYQKTS